MNIVINGLKTVLFLVIDHHGDREHGREDAQFAHGGLLPCIRSCDEVILCPLVARVMDIVMIMPAEIMI